MVEDLTDQEAVAIKWHKILLALTTGWTTDSDIEPPADRDQPGIFRQQKRTVAFPPHNIRQVYKSIISLALFQIPSVMVGEFFGEFPLLVAGMALLSVGLLSSTFSFSLFQLVLSMLLAGIGGSVYHPVGTSIVSKTSKSEKRGSKIGVLNFSGDVGKAVVPLTVSFLASAFTLHGI